MTPQPQIACPRCMPPGDPCCPYCGGTYGVNASRATISPPASPLPWRKLVSDRSVYVKIVDANGYVVAESVRPQDADFIVALANAAARPDTGESK